MNKKQAEATYPGMKIVELDEVFESPKEALQSDYFKERPDARSVYQEFGKKQKSEDKTKFKRAFILKGRFYEERFQSEGFGYVYCIERPVASPKNFKFCNYIGNNLLVVSNNSSKMTQNAMKFITSYGLSIIQEF